MAFYLHFFEMPATTALMSSFNYVGNTWAGANKALLTDLLRGERGFKGFVITDFNLYGYMDKDAALAAGGDLQLTYTAMAGAYKATDSPSVIKRMQESAHRIFYTVANSNAMNGVTPGSRIIYGIAPWQYAVWGVSAVLILIAAALGFVSYKRLFKKNKKDGAEPTLEAAASQE